jgi:exodeoxyribonuclease V alpha subunit
VTFENEEADDLQLSYAMTIHKSQGSEFPLCVIPLFKTYYTMLDRNLLYTAITRASQFVVLFGEEWAMKRAIRTQRALDRYTALKELIVGVSP